LVPERTSAPLATGVGGFADVVGGVVGAGVVVEPRVVDGAAAVCAGRVAVCVTVDAGADVGAAGVAGDVMLDDVEIDCSATDVDVSTNADVGACPESGPVLAAVPSAPTLVRPGPAVDAVIPVDADPLAGPAADTEPPAIPAPPPVHAAGNNRAAAMIIARRRTRIGRL
jgi:hypothetical protein